MKSFLLGVCLMVGISIAAWGVLGTQATSSGDAFVSPNATVRLD